MIHKLMAVCVLIAAPAAAQNDVRHLIQVWFPDGSGVELYTETSGPPAETLAADKAQLDTLLTTYSPNHPAVIQLKNKIAREEAVATQRTTVSGGGSLSDDGTHPLAIHRLVFDSRNDVVFAYKLEVEHARQSGAVNIRIKPASLANRYPTVSSVREFLSVNIGQEVTLEMLADPSTGAKVSDVLRPIDEPNPNGGAGIHAVQRSMDGVKLVLNGQALPLKSTWKAGKPAMLHVPGHGAFYLYWQDTPRCKLAGYAEKNRLIFLLDGQYAEITSTSNILTTGDHGPVWVYHDPNYRPESGSGVTREAQLITVESLEVPHATKSR